MYGFIAAWKPFCIALWCAFVLLVQTYARASGSYYSSEPSTQSNTCTLFSDGLDTNSATPIVRRMEWVSRR